MAERLPELNALLAGHVPLPREFFDRPAPEVAPDLLGRVLAHATPEGLVAVRLTEVEAYAGERDPGSHAYRGMTARNAVMYGPPGHVYVYFTYGMHWCMNLVCEAPGTAAAVLVRAGEVVFGLDLARARRPAARTDRDLARGPARLCQVLGIDRSLNGADACDAGPLYVLDGPAGSRPSPDRVARGPRVGVVGAPDLPWRFWISGEPTVSDYRPAKPRAKAR
ncbi:DNA-3-methyladenine glycosylase II [Carbonactinospora thermoautotrophica]|uniref:Putative 3-methyladenine DNA glycosylase n=2 Tax=Carbonactinospora thermoautotrophica TaxID=1469144 RepID=A0A132MSW3_9ACTN|nr:DNA-3-methyladenine glycosylase [Carbonactinospora thermoautotrophica]KWX00810.1 DNA-3-methyladenine glycosylase II [Carbonactinospora thermoautotrophica]